MFEPLTIAVAELAARWGLTPRQLLQDAQRAGIPLIFAFEGLVFDSNDAWHRSGGALSETQEFASLGQRIEQLNAAIWRAGAGTSDQFDTFPPGGIGELRNEIDALCLARDALQNKLDQRENERRGRRFRGFVRATPKTLFDIESLGAAPFPNIAYRQGGSTCVTALGRANDGERFLDGPIVFLEPFAGSDRFFKESLTIDDLCALFADIQTIEQTHLKQAEQTAGRPNVDHLCANVSTAAAGGKRTHLIVSRGAAVLSVEIAVAMGNTTVPENASAVWGELTKLAEKQLGVMIGFSSDGIQYRGKEYQANGTPDVFTRKNLRERLKRGKTR